MGSFPRRYPPGIWILKKSTLPEFQPPGAWPSDPRFAAAVRPPASWSHWSVPGQAVQKLLVCGILFVILTYEAVRWGKG